MVRAQSPFAKRHRLHPGSLRPPDVSLQPQDLALKVQCQNPVRMAGRLATADEKRALQRRHRGRVITGIAVHHGDELERPRQCDRVVIGPGLPNRLRTDEHPPCVVEALEPNQRKGQMIEAVGYRRIVGWEDAQSSRQTPLVQRGRKAKLASLHVYRREIVQGASDVEFARARNTLFRPDHLLGERQGIGESGLAVSKQRCDEQVGCSGKFE